MSTVDVLTHALEDLEKHNLAGQLNDAIANVKYAITLVVDAVELRNEQWKAWAVDRASTVLKEGGAVPQTETLLALATTLAAFVNNPDLDPKRVIQ